MKKILIGVVLGVAVLALGTAGFAYAQNQTPPAPEYPYGSGMMGNYDGFDHGRGMMDGYVRDYGHGMHVLSGAEGMGWDGEYGPMQDVMVAALAAALDLTPEEMEARHDAGETLWQIAEAEGLTEEEIRDVMFSAHDLASEDAIANGWMAEEQSEWMDAHMEQMWNGEYQNDSFGSHCGAGVWDNNNSRWQGEN